MMTQGFTWSRVGLLIKHDCVENKKNILMTLGVIFGVLLMISLLMTKGYQRDLDCRPIFHLEPDWNNWQRANTIYGVYIFIGAIFTTIIGSITFANRSTKTRRINALMLPALQSEKFVSRILVYVVGGYLFIGCSMVICDVISAAAYGMKPAVMMIERAFRYQTELQIVGQILAFGLFLLGGQALYMLGSALWPRLSFPKTFVALFAIQILIPILMPWGWMSKTIDNIAESNFFLLLIVGYIVLAGIYYATWRVFCNTQVIQRFKMK